MRILRLNIFFLILLVMTGSCSAALAITPPQTIAPSELKGFDSYPANIKKLILMALSLTRQKLAYQYGSANPKNGGMDCSGTIYYLLGQDQQTKVPRESDEQYEWVLKNGKFYQVKSNTFNSNDFAHLKPGDLLFWSGTYSVKRTIPITHVMLYLGTNSQNERLMFGASDGRTYKGKQIFGVSVFDFNLPASDSKSHFVGYGCIPNLSCAYRANTGKPSRSPMA